LFQQGQELPWRHDVDTPVVAKSKELTVSGDKIINSGAHGSRKHSIVFRVRSHTHDWLRREYQSCLPHEETLCNLNLLGGQPPTEVRYVQGLPELGLDIGRDHQFEAPPQPEMQYSTWNSIGVYKADEAGG
jgi:hypothetical protein